MNWTKELDGKDRMRNVMTALMIAGTVCFMTGCGTLPLGGGDKDEEGGDYEWKQYFEDEGDGNSDTMRSPVQEPNLEPGLRRRISSSYRLQYDDTVMIDLLGIREFQNTIEDRIDENGEISLPYLRDVKAEGKTSAELESDIRNAYISEDIYKDLNVKVIIPNQSSYYIRGEVKQPGRYPWQSGTTLSQAISSAAGRTEYSSDKVFLTRDGEVKVYDLGDIEDDPDEDVLLKPDDQIRVKRSVF